MPGQPAPGSNPFITFDCSDLKVRELGPLALPETTIVEEGRSWQVSIRFEFGGLFAKWLVNLKLPVQFSLRAESMGPGVEPVLNSVIINTSANQLVYGPGQPGPDPIITIPGGTLRAGVYKLVGVLTFPGNPPPPMAGYLEGPIIQVIKTT